MVRTESIHMYHQVECSQIPRSAPTVYFCVLCLSHWLTLRVFENRVSRRILGPKKDEITGEWRKLHNEELNDLYCSPNIVRVIKSRRMRWAGHIARMGRGEAYTGFWWGDLKERDHVRDSGVDVRIILSWICRKCDLGVWTGSSWLRIGTGGGHL